METHNTNSSYEKNDIWSSFLKDNSWKKKHMRKRPRRLSCKIQMMVQGQGCSQEFVHGGANLKVKIDDDEYHYCMDSLYF